MESLELFNKNVSLSNDTFKISTITICGKFEKIDLVSINNSLIDTKSIDLDDAAIKEIIYDPTSKKTVKQTLNVKNKAIIITSPQKIFHNCILVKLSLNNTNISVKIFKNGSIIFTGPKNISHINKIVSFLEKIATQKIKGLKISMIKSDFKYHSEIDQLLVKNAINNSSSNFKFATLNLSRYAGLNIKYDSNTVIMFKTGSIIIICKNTSELVKIYTDTINLLQNINNAKH